MEKYKIRETELKDVFRVFITGDSNDGDIIIDQEIYSENGFKEIVDDLKDLIENYSGRHELEEYPHISDIPVPYSDMGICHTLVRVEIEYIDKNGKLWEVGIQ